MAKTEAARFRATEQELIKLDETIDARNELKASENPAAKPTNRNKVLQTLVRNFAGLGPAFLSDELKELQESNRRLLGIGRNLNQVVKRIHSGEVSADVLTQRYLEELSEYVRETKESVDKLVEHNKKRGQVELGD
jgi:hypothetical protein